MFYHHMAVEPQVHQWIIETYVIRRVCIVSTEGMDLNDPVMYMRVKFLK